MSPEQAMGSPVGPASDLYSLGAVLHELLSGSVPFEGSSALGTLHRHLHEPPEPLRRLRPDVPPALETLVLRLLAKSPAQRPADAHAVYQALAPLLPTAAAYAPSWSGLCDPTRPFRLPFAPWPDRTAPRTAAEPAATAVAPTSVPPPSLAPPPPPAPVTGRPPTGMPPTGAPLPAAEADLLAATVDEARRLLGLGRISQALGLLGGALRTAEARHGVDSPVAVALRRQYAALQPHAHAHAQANPHANGTAGATPHRP
jgi:serine/threonine protein kinase